MNTLVWFWNIVHYSLYRWEVYIGNIISYPIRKILGGKNLSEKYRRRGVENPAEIITETLNDPKYGVRVILAGGAVNIFMFFIIYSFYNLLKALKILDIDLTLIHYFILCGMALALNYVMLFKNDKYLEYFKEFAEMTSKKRNKYAWLSFLTLVVICIITVLSFLYAN